jgi:transglutaminase-like putative cysteine protease
LVGSVLAAVSTIMATVGVSTAAAAPATCAPSANQWVGSYSGTARMYETAEPQPVLVDVVRAADGSLWAEVEHPATQWNPFETTGVTLTDGALTITTNYSPVNEDYNRYYKGTSVSCGANGAVTRFAGELDLRGFNWQGTVAVDGTFQVARD